MAEVKQDARIKQGGSYTLRVLCVDDDGSPLNLSGTDLFYKVAKRKSSPEPALLVDTITTEQGDGDGVVQDVAVIPLTTEDTTALQNRRYYHELFMIDVEGEKGILMTGSLQVVETQAAKFTEET
jgi:hypothetical protein